jgi:hypothetical protein
VIHPHITGHDCRQLLLLPVSLVDYPKNPMRFIEAAVDGPPQGLFATVREDRPSGLAVCLAFRDASC